jgi:hypothetical protein
MRRILRLRRVAEKPQRQIINTLRMRLIDRAELAPLRPHPRRALQLRAGLSPAVSQPLRPDARF